MQAGGGWQPPARPQKKMSSFAFFSDERYFRGKKRKQASRDADSLSLCTLDINEPSAKRSKALVSGVTSLASLLPIKTAPLKRFGQTLQRSISFRTERALPPPPPPLPPPRALATSFSSSSSSSSSMKTRVTSAAKSNSCSSTTSSSSGSTLSRVATGTGSASKRRDSKLWSETFDVHLGATQTLSPKDIKRQEAIFELAQGEQDLVDDLKLAKKAYHDPMRTLSIMTEQELNQIFSTLDSLIPLHEDLLSRLCQARNPDGSTEHVGQILTEWLPCLSSYTAYCSNQVWAKALLDQKKQNLRVQDFLQRCQQSPFSRKLDLWNFLDIPRSRLVKYPLLLREILKHTPDHHPDRPHLDQAMLLVQGLVGDINRHTGESECQFYKDRLLYTEVDHRDALIQRSRTLSCHGELKNNRGLKLHVFLFQDVLVITRAVALNEQPVSYQLCRRPIPIRQLDLEDLEDGEMRVGGSIRGAFSNNERTKNFFRVSYRVSGGALQSHCFQASDAFNKQQWLNCIRQAKEAAQAQTARQDASCSADEVTAELESEEGMDPETEDNKRLHEEGKADTGSEAAAGLETGQVELKVKMENDIGESHNGDAEEEMEEALDNDEEYVRC